MLFFLKRKRQHDFIDTVRLHGSDVDPNFMNADPNATLEKNVNHCDPDPR